MNNILSASLQISLAIALSLSLASCGEDKKSKPSANNQAATQVTRPAEPVVKSAPVPESATETQATGTPVVETTPVETVPETKPAPDNKPDAKNRDQMLALAKKSGCLACHSIDKKVVGPAWKDVAARYKGNSGARQQLIEKISSGGKGNWTEITGGVPMPPYHPRVSKENIERLVVFVLSL